MGLYDKYFKDNVIRFEIIKMTSEEAYVAIMFCALKANEMVAREGLHSLEYIITRFKGFVAFTPTHFQNLEDRFLKIVDKEGLDTLIGAAKRALESNLKEPAFVNAMEIIMADGIVDAKEKIFLEKLQAAMGVSDDRVKQIVDILAVKNRGTSADMMGGDSTDKKIYT